MSNDFPRNLAQKGRPASRDVPKELISKKLHFLFNQMPYTEICKFFGVSRESAKSYLSGITFPGAKELNNLRRFYFESFGKLIDLDWLLNDEDSRLGPVFKSSSPPPIASGEKIDPSNAYEKDPRLPELLAISVEFQEGISKLQRRVLSGEIPVEQFGEVIGDAAEAVDKVMQRYDAIRAASKSG